MANHSQPIHSHTYQCQLAVRARIRCCMNSSHGRKLQSVLENLVSAARICRCMNERIQLLSVQFIISSLIYLSYSLCPLVRAQQVVNAQPVVIQEYMLVLHDLYSQLLVVIHQMSGLNAGTRRSLCRSQEQIPLIDGLGYWGCSALILGLITIIQSILPPRRLALARPNQAFYLYIYLYRGLTRNKFIPWIFPVRPPFQAGPALLLR